jgi:hypothetical protein
MTRVAMLDRRAATRLVETLEGLQDLRAAVKAWTETFAQTAHVGQYRTQLTSLSSVLLPTLHQIERHVEEAASKAEGRRIYGLARATDQRVAFCWRLWRWFADRFDQREDEVLRPTLLAADEVVWSVWATAWRAAGQTPGPAPLPYIDTVHIANATPRVAPPAAVRVSNSDDLLREQLATLPIPIIGLPPVVLRRPWWLVVAVHEAGHHVQYDLDEHLVARVAVALGEAVTAVGADEQQRREWSNWGRELFADAFSAVMVGPASLWAVEELEQRDGAGLLSSPNPLYPPPVVRVAAMRAALEAVGHAAPDTVVTMPAEPQPDAAERVGQLREHVEPAVDTLLDVPMGQTSLRSLGSDALARSQAAARWRNRLADGNGLAPERKLEAARDCLAGAVQAWSDSVDGSGPALELGTLRERMLNVLTASREEGVRATTSAPPTDEAVAGLVGVLLDPEAFG